MTYVREKRVAPLACTACTSSADTQRAPTMSRWSRPASLVSAAALVLLPKCPLCLIGWLGAIGLGGIVSHAGTIPVVCLGLFGASQAVFLVSARRTGDARALIAAALGVAWLVACYAFGGGPTLRLIGIGFLVAASAFNAIATARSRSLRRRASVGPSIRDSRAGRVAAFSTVASPRVVRGDSERRL